MKTISNILATIIVALFLLSFGMKSEAVGQIACDSSQTSKIDTVIVNGCEYEVELCIECTVTHPGRVEVKNVKKLDDSCVTSPLLTPDQEVAQITSQLSTWAYAYFEVCLVNAPPCDINDPLIITYVYPRCWLMLKDTIAKQTWYVPCSDEACEVTYSQCIDMPGMTLRQTFLYSSTVGNNQPSCFGVEGHTILPPTQHMVPTDCFILHTPCD